MAGNNSAKTYSCDGTDSNNLEVSRHPLVYFKLETSQKIECPYCGKIFTNNKDKINDT